MTSSKAVFYGLARQGISILCGFLLIWFPLGVPAFAQYDVPPQQPAQAPPPAQLLNPAQLDDLVAPIALYPDPLLSQVLVASTYPLEIVEAWQWLQQNRNLQGQQLVAAARQQNWDASVQALVVFPDVMGKLNSDISWTTDLGNAFLAQQADVMNAVQRMRARAQAAGRLTSDPEQTVTTQTQNGQTEIVIVPANPQVIYVPQYNPMYVWGPPVWGYYPPLYYPAIGFGFGFGAGIFLGAFFGGWGGWGWGGWGGWGWGPNWFGRSILTNGLFFNHYGFGGLYAGGLGRGGVWAHNPYHRLGVPYSSAGLAARFGGNYAGRGGMVRSGMAGQRGAAVAGGRVQGNARSMGGNAAAGGGWQHFGANTGSSLQHGNGFSQSRGQVQGNARYGGAAAGGGGQWSHFNGFNSATTNRGGGFSGRSYSSGSFGGGSRAFSGAARSSGGSYGGGGSRSFGGGGGSRSFGGHSSGGGHGGGHGGHR